MSLQMSTVNKSCLIYKVLSSDANKLIFVNTHLVVLSFHQCLVPHPPPLGATVLSPFHFPLVTFPPQGEQAQVLSRIQTHSRSRHP